ncbi:MAG TPA: hypothetical protein VEN81_01490, partial [Planctomycetota bacterium]|nr:hypothetical protein [Planctomycetota bacterium]
FEALVLKTAEMPKGYTLEKAESDVRTVVRDLGLPEVQASEVTHAWRAGFKPAGTVFLIEIPDSAARNKLESALGQKGPTWTHEGFLLSVQGPDDETLDALENRLREKIGWDRKPPRPIHLLQARLLPADLPPGLTLSDEAIDRRTYSCQIKGPQFTLEYKVQETFDYGLIEKAKAALPYKPGHVLLVKDTVVAFLAGPEPAWTVLDQMEATLRKKMRLGPETVEEYEISPRDLPKGSIFLNGAHGLTPNPQILQAPSKDLVASWRGCVDPSLTLVDVDELVDPPHAAARAAGDRTLFAQEGPQKPLKSAVFTRGRFVARVRQVEKVDEESFQEISEILRAKLRLPR